MTKHFNYLKQTWIKKYLWLLITCWLLTSLFLWPTLTHFTTHLPSEQDGLFIIWTINWISHAFLTGKNIFQAPIFFPFAQTLAYSQPMIGQGIINIIFSFWTQNLVVMSNLHLILGAASCYLAMFMLGDEITKKTWSSTIMALVFTFSSWHMQFIVHLHTFLLAGIPLTIWSFLRYQNKAQYRYLFLTTIFCLFQISNDPIQAFFLFTILLIFTFNKNSLQIIKLHWIEILATGLGVLIIVCAIYWPYFQVYRQFHYVRSIRDAAHSALSINQVLSLEMMGIFVYLCSCLVLMFRKQKKALRSTQKQLLSYLIILAIGLVLSLGPVAKWQGKTIKILHWPIPLPYAVLYYLVPGFQAFRASSRWIVVANFGLSLSLGWVIAKIQLRSLTKFLTLIFITGWIWWFNHDYLLLPIKTNMPGIYQQVKLQPQKTLAELPAYIWSQQPDVTAESYRLMYQSYHQKSLYNGASGFTPPSRLIEWPLISATFPQPSALSPLKDAGVELVLVHYAEYQHLFEQQTKLDDNFVLEAETIKKQISDTNELILLNCQDQDCLYKLQ